MKVLLIVLQYPPKRFIGAELYDHAISKGLIKAGHTVDVLTTDSESEKDSKPWLFEGVEVNNTNIYKTKYDVILTHVDLRQKAYYYARITDNIKTPIVGIQHNDNIGTVGAEKLYMWHGLIYNSEYMFKASQNVYAQKQILLPPITDVGRTGLSKGKAITQINLTQMKGGDKFWELVKLMPDQEFIAVEGGWGKQIIPFEIPDNVKLITQTTNLKPIWEQTSLLLMLSVKESWGMVATEAGRYGIPTVSYDYLKGVEENLKGQGIYVDKNFELKNISQIYIDNTPNKKVQSIAKEHALTHKKQVLEVIEFLKKIAKIT